MGRALDQHRALPDLTALRELSTGWRDQAQAADRRAERYDADRDGGNAHAFRKEARIWNTCANNLTAALEPLASSKGPTTTEHGPLVESIAHFVEHLRDWDRNSDAPVGMVARRIRQHFRPEALSSNGRTSALHAENAGSTPADATNQRCHDVTDAQDCPVHRPDYRALLVLAREFVADAIELSSEVRTPRFAMKECLRRIDAALAEPTP